MGNSKLMGMALLGATANQMGGGYYSMGGNYFGRGGTQQTYHNKNANVEYYYDEKGNMKRRKVR